MVVEDIVTGWLLLTKGKGAYGLPRIRPMLQLGPKLLLSVQASEFHYCLPRNNNGPWTHVEVAVFGGMPKILKPYFEGMPGGVCGYVPITRINYLIHKHGGVKCIDRPRPLAPLSLS